MTISNRAKVIIAAVIMILAIILILLFVPRRQPNPVNTPVTNNQQNVPTTTNTTRPTTPAPPLTPEQQSQASLETVGKIFVERYGSYSTESDLANLEDILPLATDRYRVELQAYINKTRASAATPGYYGVSTRVLATEVAVMDDAGATATLSVTTQREESKGSVQSSEVRYQTIELNLRKVSGEWKVDKATWK